MASDERALVPIKPPPLPSSSSSSSSGARHASSTSVASTMLNKKAVCELDDQLQRAHDECRSKDERIAELQELTSNGKLQKRLQASLEENRDMKKKLDFMYVDVKRADELEDELVQQRDLVDALRNDLLAHQTLKQETVAKLSEERQNVDEEIEDMKGNYEELKQSETKALHHAREMELRVEELERKDAENELILSRLKDGSRTRQLEHNIEHLTEMLQTKEQEQVQLESEINRLSTVNERLSEECGEFEHVIQRKLDEAVSDVGAELRRVRDEVSSKERELEAECERYTKLESRVAETDKHVINLMQTIKQYEEGYGIEDAMMDQRQLKASIVLRDQDIAKMSAKLMEREKQMQILVDENKQLKTMSGVSDDWGLDPTQLALAHNAQSEQFKALNTHLETRIRKLEAERVELLNELRVKAVQCGDDGVTFYGLSADKMRLVETYAERLRHNDMTLPQSDDSVAMHQRVLTLNDEISEQRLQYANIVLQLDDARQQLLSAAQRTHTHDVDSILKSIGALDQRHEQQQKQLQQQQQHSHTQHSHTQHSHTQPSCSSADDVCVPVKDARRRSSRPASHCFVVERARSTSAPPPPPAAAVTAAHDEYKHHHVNTTSALSNVLNTMEHGDVSLRLLWCVEELLSADTALAQCRSVIALHERTHATLAAQTSMMFKKMYVLKNKTEEKQREKIQKITHLEETVLNLQAENASLSSYVGTLQQHTHNDVADTYRRELVVLRSQHDIISRRSDAAEHAATLQQARITQLQHAMIEQQCVLKARVLQLVEHTRCAQQRVLTLENELAACVCVAEHHRVVRERDVAAARLGVAEVRAARLAQQCAAHNITQQHVTELRERVTALDTLVEQLNAANVILQRTLDDVTSTDVCERVQLLSRVSALDITVAHSDVRCRRAQNELVAERERRNDVTQELMQLQQRFEHAQHHLDDAREQCIAARHALAQREARNAHTHPRDVDDDDDDGDERVCVVSKSLANVARHRNQMHYACECKDARIDELQRVVVTLEERSHTSLRVGKVLREHLHTKLHVKVIEQRLDDVVRDQEDMQAMMMRNNDDIRRRDNIAFQHKQGLRKQLHDLYAIVAMLRDEVTPTFSVEQARVICDSNACVTERLDECQLQLVKERERRFATELELDKVKMKTVCLNDDDDDDKCDDMKISHIDENMNVNDIQWRQRLRQLKMEKIDVEHAKKTLQSNLEFTQNALRYREDDVRRLHRVIAEKDSALEAAQLRFRDSVEKLPAQTSIDRVEQQHVDNECISTVEHDVDDAENARLVNEVISLQALLRTKEKDMSALREQFELMEKSRRTKATNDDCVSTNFIAEKESVLRTAELTISALQDLLIQKNSSIERYALLLEDTVAKHRQDKQVDRIELERLQARLAHDNVQTNAALHDVLRRIDNTPNRGVDVVSLEHVQQMLCERDTQYAHTITELQAAQQREAECMQLCVQAKQRECEHAERIRELEIQVKNEHEMTQIVEDLKSDLGDKQRKQMMLEDAIVTLKQELVMALKQRAQAMEKTAEADVFNDEATALRHTVRQRCVQCAKLRAQVKALQVCHDDDVRQHAEVMNDIAQVKQENTVLCERVDEMRKQHVKRLKKCKQQQAVIVQLEEQLRQQQAMQQQQQQQDELQQQPEKQQAEQQQAEQCNTLHRATKDIGVQCVELVETNNTNTHTSHTNTHTHTNAAAFDTWHTHKRLQRRVELLKSKLRQRVCEMREMSQREQNAINKLNDVERDNSKILLRITHLQDKLTHKNISDEQLDVVEALRVRVFELEQQHDALKRHDDVVRAQQIIMLEHANTELTKKLRERDDGVGGVVRAHTHTKLYADIDALKMNVETLEKKLLTATCDNLQLRFDVEQNNIANVRLRKRLRELHDVSQRVAAHARSEGLTVNDDDDDDDDDGELKHIKITVDTLYKVVETLRNENETLKRNSNRHSKTSDVSRSLKKAKNDLSDEVDKLKVSLVSASTEIASLKRAETSMKLKLRQQRKQFTELKKVHEDTLTLITHDKQQVEQLNDSIKSLQQQIHMLKQQNAEREQRLKCVSDERRELQHRIDNVIVPELNSDVNVASSAMTVNNESSQLIQHSNAENIARLKTSNTELMSENEALKNELSAFDVSFFDEIEELKFKFHQASETLKVYERRYGVLESSSSSSLTSAHHHQEK